MGQVAGLPRLTTLAVQPRLLIGRGFHHIAQQLATLRSCASRGRRILGHETLPSRPGLDQRAIHREVLFAQQLMFPRLLQHRLQQPHRHLARQQPLPVFGEHRRVPHRLVRIHAHEPAKQQVVIQLLHQLPFAADGIQNLQQQRSQQSFRRNRRPSPARIRRLKIDRHLLQRPIHHGSDPPQRMVARNPVFHPPITEHRVLLFVFSAHVLGVTHNRVQMR